MTLWLLGSPFGGPRFAEAIRRGTYGRKLTDAYAERLRPLVIEWKPGSVRIGDFTWPGLDDDVVVKNSVGEEIVSQFAGAELSPVKMIQGKVRRLKSGRANGVDLPYKGPPLNDLWITARCSADPKRTTVDATGALVGAEHFAAAWNPKTNAPTWRRVPRRPGYGVYVKRRSLRGADIFRVDGFISIFCRDEVRRFIEERNFTNVACLAAGEVI